ncbi:MAG: NAD(P)-dependent oxidoreductase [Leptothrix sp. (in: b-proteobacteria)]
MDLLIAEPLEAEVLQWLDARHDLFYAPRLASQERHLFLDALAQARAVLLPPQVAIDASTLAAAPRLRAIGRIVGGPEPIDLSACTRAGIEVVRCIDAAAPAEAEFIIGALLALMRPSPADVGRVAGRELGTSTVGLVGMNMTSRRVARLLQQLGSRVIGYDPALHASDPNWVQWGIQPVSLQSVFEGADAVSVQMPYFSRYRGLLGERALRHAKPGQVLVSVSPFALFDAEVLAELLHSGQLTAAWLDHLPAEATEAGQPLHGAPGLLGTPRLAAYTREARVRSAWGVARQIDEVLRSTPSTARPGTHKRSSASEPARRAAGVDLSVEEEIARRNADAVAASRAAARAPAPVPPVAPIAPIATATPQDPSRPWQASAAEASAALLPIISGPSSDRLRPITGHTGPGGLSPGASAGLAA